MFIILILSFVGLWYLTLNRTRQITKDNSIRLSFLITLVSWSLILIIITESLSFYHALTYEWIAICWGIIVLVCSTTGLVLNHRNQKPLLLKRPFFTKPEKQLAGAIIFILSITLITGLLYPPNNNDSLAYHMARISHRLQLHSVAPYATHIERQIYQPPLTEWVIMHIDSLVGSDRLANFVQWFWGIGALVSVSLLAQQLGGSRTTQLLSAFVAATIPMVILQMSSTQNDVFLSCNILILINLLLYYYHTRRIFFLFMAGLSLGESWLSKGTGYLFSAPILIFWGIAECVRLYRQINFISLIKLVGKSSLLIILAVLLNLGHYNRNYSIYNNLLVSPEEQAMYTNEIHTPGAILSNVLRNIADECGVPGVHYVVQHGIEYLHRWLGITPSDERITFNHSVFDLPMLSNNEDNASNFVHLLLFVSCLFWLSIRRRRKADKPFLLLASLCVITFLIFCFYLKWQPWHSRLHTTLFLLASPMGGYGLEEAFKQKNFWPAWVLFASAFCFALTNPTRPIITIPPLTAPASFLHTPRENNYYVQNRSLLPIQQKVANFLHHQISNQNQVGLIIDKNDWDYSWFLALGKSYQLYHINVVTESKKVDTHPRIDFIVSTIICSDSMTYQGKPYVCVLKPGELIKVFSPISSIIASAASH